MRNLKQIMRYLFGVLFMLAGANHFRATAFYVNIMPSYLPWQLELVYLSGILEFALGALLLIRRASRLAAWGAIVLMIGVFPANLHMALHSESYPSFSPVAIWLRLPFQAVLIAWAYWLTRTNQEPQTHRRF